MAVLYYQLVVRIRLGGGVTTDAVTGPPPPMELPEALSPVQAEESKTSCMFELETKPEAALEPIYAMEPETFGQIAARIPVVPQVEQTIEAPVGELPMKSGVTRIERFLASVKLTEREHEIAVRILQGETSRSIAEDLGITGSTVNSHVLNIAEKFGVSNRKGLLVKYGCFD